MSILTPPRIGPANGGLRMSLAEFEQAVCEDGFRFELSRGVVAVNQIPNLRHFRQMDAVLTQFYAYRVAKLSPIQAIGTGGDCKILIEELQSQRHPDVLIYHTDPPSEDVWSRWIPEIVIEIVSPSSRKRDYEEKPTEYLLFGVQEYWILDAERNEMLVHQRWSGRWRTTVIPPTATYNTHLLPGFTFSCAEVFAAAANFPESEDDSAI